MAGGGGGLPTPPRLEGGGAFTAGGGGGFASMLFEFLDKCVIDKCANQFPQDFFHHKSRKFSFFASLATQCEK